MDHYFSIQVDANNGCGTSVVTTADTLSEAFTQGIREAAHYLLICGYAPTIGISRACSTCYGGGTVRKSVSRTRSKSIRCPACRGKDSTVSIVENVRFPVHAVAAE